MNKTSEEVQRIVDATVKVPETLESRARFAAKHLVEGGSVMLSDDAIMAMALLINGPRREDQSAKIGSCPICGGEPGQCVKSAHGYAEKEPLRDTTDGKPPAPGLEASGAPQPINEATGQHKAYWVLSATEIAKGLVRPVRESYKHKTCGVVTSMGEKLALTYARDPKFYGSTFCVSCKGHFPVSEFVWEPVGPNGAEVVGS